MILTAQIADGHETITQKYEYNKHSIIHKGSVLSKLFLHWPIQTSQVTWCKDAPVQSQGQINRQTSQAAAWEANLQRVLKHHWNKSEIQHVEPLNKYLTNVGLMGWQIIISLPGRLHVSVQSSMQWTASLHDDTRPLSKSLQQHMQLNFAAISKILPDLHPSCSSLHH
jgi:hypothetical protein